MTTRLSFEPRRLLPVGRRSWLIRTPGFTVAEVRRLLRAAPDEPRTRAIARCAARIDAWLPPEPHFIACPVHAWQHLPRIVLWYTRGDLPTTIARRIGSLGSAWVAERALDVACARMADCINRDPDAFGLPRRGWSSAPMRPWDRR